MLRLRRGIHWIILAITGGAVGFSLLFMLVFFTISVAEL